ncbi:MAG: response regulator [Piscirickettsiaceae bacterium]|nr:response regulator [Piscirickettsiaceae bacterium]
MMADKHYILVADDEPMNQLIMQELLKDNFDLACVNNGIECVRSVQERRPDMILMDVNMPDMDGLEATRKIKSLEGCIDLPILLVSVLATQSEMQVGLASGADYYITKPFEGTTLMDAIRTFL